MIIWHRINKYEKTFSINLLQPQFTEMAVADIAPEITRVRPDYAFSDGSTYVLLKKQVRHAADLVYEVKRIDAYFAAHEPHYEQLQVRKRERPADQQVMLCYAAGDPESRRYYMLTLHGQGQHQYLYLFSCQYEQRDVWEPRFFKMLESILIYEE